MPTFQNLLSVSRHLRSKPSPSQIHLLHHRCSLLSFSNSISSSTDPPSPAETPTPNRTSSPPSSVKVVSYPLKPKDPSSPADDSPPPQQWRPRGPPRHAFQGSDAVTEPPSPEGPEARSWTREDVRYVKNVPEIKPVAYPLRVAPLPEDRSQVKEPATEAEGEEGKAEGELENERKRIEAEAKVRRLLRIEEEEVAGPFPTLLKTEKKKQRVVVDLQEAIREVKANARQGFIETVEAHVRLGVDPRRGDQMVRGATTLPHGTGKIVRVAVFAEGAAAEEARAAGADIVGGDELVEEIKNSGGKFNFDKCISTPAFMPRLGKIARILGPRGMMPNPKLGSVTNNVGGALKEAKCGRIDFKIDKTAIVHVGLGKVNFSDDHLRENVGAFVNALLLAKPMGLKKTSKYSGYVNSFTLCSTGMAKQCLRGLRIYLGLISVLLTPQHQKVEMLILVALLYI